MKNFFIILFLLIAGLSFAQPFSMDEEASLLLPDVTNGKVLWGDYDGDNDMDILLSGNINTSPILKLFNNNNGLFEDTGIEFTGLTLSCISWNDFDNDNDLDILYSGNDENGLSITVLYKNTGQGQFEEEGSNILGVQAGEVSWGDLDNDGDEDVIMHGEKGADGITRIYRNDGNGIFENLNHNLINAYNGDVDLGDYDNDLDLDILLIGYYKDDLGLEQKALKLYRNDGDFIFTEINAGFIGMSESNVQWADYDADGDLDILANGSTEAPTHLVYLYKNQGNDFFLNIGIEIYGTVNGTVNWGDYDNDGDLDFLLTGMSSYNSEPITEIYRNVAEDLFNKEDNQNLPGVFNSSTQWADYDLDGDLDVVMSGQVAESGELLTAIYKNKNEKMNELPMVSGNLSSQVSENMATLLWAASNDAETESENLTYNVRMGSFSGGNDILSSMSSETGYRAVNQFGNAGYNASLKIEGLSPGTFYWSVQAIDNNFAGSGFSMEESFNILPLEMNEGNLETEIRMNVFPNPFLNHVNIHINGDKVYEVSIFNNAGKQVKSFDLSEKNSAVIKLFWDGTNTSGLEVSDGLYYIVCKEKEERNIQYKMIKR